MNPNLPIVVGLCGVAGSGKTSTADKISPPNAVFKPEDQIHWSHLYYAIPLYEMATTMTKIDGADAKDRKLYRLHATLHDLLSDYIPYDDLIELVYDIYHVPCVVNGTKPRNFLQKVGDLCRNKDDDCFVNWMYTKIMKDFSAYKSSLTTDADEAPLYGVVVSDIRRPNEAEWIKDHPNGILIKFTASPEVLHDRLFDRDNGIVLTPEQANHPSETDVGLIPDEWFTEIIDTNDLSIDDQAYATLSAIYENLRFETEDVDA